MAKAKKRTEIIRRLENKVQRLEKYNRKIGKEMIERGKEVTKMIRIFLVCEHLLPEGQREEFRNVAIGYAARNDTGRECYCPGEIDFGNVRHEGTNIKYSRDKFSFRP